MTEPEARIEVAEFLGNLSQELGRLAEMAARLDAATGDVALAAAATRPPALVHLQEMDALRQALGAVQRITSNAARLTGQGPGADLPKRALVEGITVSAVERACLDGPGSRPMPGHGAADADVWF